VQQSQPGKEGQDRAGAEHPAHGLVLTPPMGGPDLGARTEQQQEQAELVDRAKHGRCHARRRKQPGFHTRCHLPEQRRPEYQASGDFADHPWLPEAGEQRAQHMRGHQQHGKRRQQLSDRRRVNRQTELPAPGAMLVKV
jgi:hypothetical protein